MAIPAERIRTLEDAAAAVSIMKTRMQIMATAMADALADAQANLPGACDRIAQRLEKARADHLRYLRGPE